MNVYFLFGTLGPTSRCRSLSSKTLGSAALKFLMIESSIQRFAVYFRGKTKLERSSNVAAYKIHLTY